MVRVFKDAARNLLAKDRMTAQKFAKLGLLAFITAKGFDAWAGVIRPLLPEMLQGVATPAAMVMFVMVQYLEAQPDIMNIGCESPASNLRKVRIARRSAVDASLLQQDLLDEYYVEPREKVNAIIAQAFAFGVDFLMCVTGYWPFTASLSEIAIAPMGLLDFNFFNAVMLVTTVFFTPRILVSALKDGRFKKAKGA